MKNIIFASCFFLIFTSVKAQDTLSINAGFTLTPQGTISLQNPEKGFSSITSVAACVSFSKGNTMVNAMYSLTSNKVQMVYWHKLGHMTGIYTSFNKSVLTKGGYASVGVTRAVAGGRATGFFEIGSTWHEWHPAIYTGAIIPLMFKVK